MLAVLLAVLLAGASAVVVCRPAGEGRQRLNRIGPAPDRARSPRFSPQAACLAAGLALALVVGLPLGIVPGLLVAATGPRLLARLEPRSVQNERRQLVADLPLVLDLLAACLAGGASLPAAAAAVSAAVPGPCGARLAAVASALAVGSSPPQAWAALAGNGAADPTDSGGTRPVAEDPLAPAARLLVRACEGGAPVAATVIRLAADARAESRAVGDQRARRIGVLVVAPLGLCFLPAFVLLGVVPVVIGLAGPVLSSL